jgi:hypothetical protein
VNSLQLADFCFVDIHVDHPGPGREGGEFSRGPVVEPRPQGDQEIAFGDGPVRRPGTVHAQHPQVEGILRREGSQGEQGGGHRYALFPGEVRQGFRRGSPGGAAGARVDDRPLGPGHLGGDALYRFGTGFRRFDPPARFGPPVEGAPFGLDVLGHVHDDRSRPSGPGDLEGSGQLHQQVRGGLDQHAVLGDGRDSP